MNLLTHNHPQAYSNERAGKELSEFFHFGQCSVE